jgi:hypothetical protein
MLSTPVTPHWYRTAAKPKANFASRQLDVTDKGPKIREPQIRRRG